MSNATINNLIASSLPIHVAIGFPCNVYLDKILVTMYQAFVVSLLSLCIHWPILVEDCC